MQNRETKQHSAPITALMILGKTLLLLPIVAAMAYINYTVDVSGIFHSAQYEEDIALALLGGLAVDHYDQMDERGVTQKVSQLIETPFDSLSLGSSRVLQLREDAVNGGQFYNAGVSGADFVDVVGLYYRFEQTEQIPSTVILSLDHWWLSDNYYNIQERSDKNLYNEFLNVALGLPAEYEPEEEPNFRYDVLFSPTYLQGNLDQIARGGRQYTPPATVSDDFEHQDTNLKMSDGSVFYSEDYRNMPQDERTTIVLNQAVEFVWSDGFTEISEEQSAIFDEFVQYLLAKDIQVIFVISPLHPMVYEHLLEYPDIYAGFFETEPFYTEYALEHNIPMYGSYNPFVTNSTADDFYDGLHMKDSHWQHIFPGVEEALEDQAQDEAYSPWILGRVRVEETVAERLVRERYEIGSENELRSEDDEKVLGATSYVFSRYGFLDNTEEMVQLARYAVTQDEGIIYRYDTEEEKWVLDKRGLLG